MQMGWTLSPLLTSSKLLAMCTAGHFSDENIISTICDRILYIRKQLEDNIKAYRQALGRLNHRIGFAIKVLRNILLVRLVLFQSSPFCSEIYLFNNIFISFLCQANYNPALLTIIKEEGLSAVAVSGNEVLLQTHPLSLIFISYLKPESSLDSYLTLRLFVPPSLSPIQPMQKNKLSPLV